jgi:Domain of unknown function (DUF4304)
MVGPWLRARGFKKRRNRFRRADDDGWQVVDFQASQWGHSDDVRLTINLWVGVKELAAADSGSEVEVRVGRLLPGGKDRWWELDASTDAAALAEELCRMLRERCLPWLDARRSLDDLMALARTEPEDFPRHMCPRLDGRPGHCEIRHGPCRRTRMTCV